MKPIFIATLLLLFTCTATTSCQTRRPTANVPAEMMGRGVKRVQSFAFDDKPFATAAAPLRTQMTFFSNIKVSVNWTKVENTNQPPGKIWTGQVDGSSGGPATLTISGKSVSANISRGNGMIYQIRTTADGQVWVREMDPSALPRESEPVRRPE